MELKLAENIKRMRKERSLTQEALANALGVTVGAVYKWEANLSSPELEMLVRIADLFDKTAHRWRKRRRLSSDIRMTTA